MTRSLGEHAQLVAELRDSDLRLIEAQARALEEDVASLEDQLFAIDLDRGVPMARDLEEACRRLTVALDALVDCRSLAEDFEARIRA